MLIPMRHPLLIAALGTLALGACGLPDSGAGYPVLHARTETDPVPSHNDAADDPAIWINPERPDQSRIIGTDKQSGLVVFDFEGRQLQYLPAGHLNNVDIRPDPAAPAAGSILAASARNPSEVVLFRLDHATTEVTELLRHRVDLESPYGICLTVLPDATLKAVVTSQDGVVAQYVIDVLDKGFNLLETRRFQLASQPEGCVVDDRTGRLFVGEEGRGIWASSVRADATAAPVLFADVTDGVLVPDVEGLTLLHGERTLLIASSQGDNSYAVYDTEDGNHLTSFRIGDGGGIDGTQETDGIDATSSPLPGYPQGLLVVQDGINTHPDARQNFKFLSLEDVYALIAR